MSGVSVIITKYDQSAAELDQNLSSFFNTNVYDPVELIILERHGNKETAQVIARHATKGFIRLVRNFSPETNSISQVTQKVRYPKIALIHTLEDIARFSQKTLPLQEASELTKDSFGLSENDQEDPEQLFTAGLLIKEFTYLLKQAEERISRNSFLIDNINVWPLVKIYLYFSRYDITFAGKGLKMLRQESKANFSNPLEATKSDQGSFLTPGGTAPISNTGKGNVLFMCKENEHSCPGTQGLLVHRYFDPLIESLPEGYKGVKLDCSRKISEQSLYLYQPIHCSIKTDNVHAPDIYVCPESIKDLNQLFQAYGMQKEISIEEIEKSLRNIASQISWFEDIIDKWQPQAIFLRCYYCIHWHPLLIAAQKAGIPVVDVQHGRTGPFHPAYTHWNHLDDSADALLPDIFWLWSARWAECIKTSTLRNLNRRLLVAGDPWADFSQKYLSRSQIDRIKDIRQKFSRVVIVSLQQYSHNQLPDYVYDAITSSPGKDFFWLIREHPQAEHKNKLIEWLEKEDFYHADHQLVSQLPAAVTLDHADIHLTCDSTFAYEAADMGVPTLFTSSHGEESFRDIVNAKMASKIDSEAQLIDKIKTLPTKALNAPQTSSLTLQQTSNLLERLLTCNATGLEH